MDIYTIGFAQRNAAGFFTALKAHGIERLIDVRIHNSSQLAGYSKRDDLAYFLREIAGAEYRHEPALAPTPELLRAYRSNQIDWPQYEAAFLALMAERRIEDLLERSLFEQRTVLLCSEPQQTFCHRRLVVEYLDAHWGNVRSLPI